MRRLPAILALAAALAGCSGDAPASDTPPDGGGPDAPATAERPTWEVGQWWTYASSESGPMTLVVAADQGSDWLVATDNADVAFFDQRFSDISYLGPQRKSDLAGSQGGDRVEYFRWPLADGLNWTTRWDGQDVRITAHDRGEGRFHLASANATGQHATYDYDPAVGWFRTLAFYDPDGSESFRIDLTDSGRNYTGVVRSWELVEEVAQAGQLPPGLLQGTFTASPGITDVWMSYTVECSAGAFALRAVSTSSTDRSFGTHQACPVMGGGTGTFTPQPMAPLEDENWLWAVSGTPATMGTYAFTVLLRTLVETPLG